MRALKNSLVFAIIIVAVILFSKNMIGLYMLASINVIVISFNLLVRKSNTYKPYFLSKKNIFSAKHSKQFEVDLPADLAFDKIIEVIEESGFRLVTADKEQLAILAISKMSFRSWGENLYFSLEERGTRTLVKFDSAALFQLYSWGKNEDNYDVFFEKLEDSFTI